MQYVTSGMINNIQEVQQFINPEKEALLSHPLYPRIQNISDLQKFTEIHIYAVWDFMSLLKALQIKLTCTTIPWFASTLPNTRYLINEIVLAEESDDYLDGRKLSHFEMYIDAMDSLGANIKPINELIEKIKNGGNLNQVINSLNVDSRIKEFLNFTFQIIESGEPHKIASAFTFGREDLIPEMFTSILRNVNDKFPSSGLEKLIYYFQRHIELDGDEHGPLAMKMITELADNDPVKWIEIKETAKSALQYRIELWNAIADSL